MYKYVLRRLLLAVPVLAMWFWSPAYVAVPVQPLEPVTLVQSPVNITGVTAALSPPTPVTFALAPNALPR